MVSQQTMLLVGGGVAIAGLSYWYLHKKNTTGNDSTTTGNAAQDQSLAMQAQANYIVPTQAVGTVVSPPGLTITTGDAQMKQTMPLPYNT